MVREHSMYGDMARAYLRREVEPQIAVVLHTVLDKQWHLAGQTEFDGVRQSTRLAEVREILQRKGEGHGLGQVNLDVLAGLVHTAMLPELNGAGANVTLASELDAFLRAFNGDWVELAWSNAIEFASCAMELKERYSMLKARC
jgi:hypothetical protein